MKAKQTRNERRGRTAVRRALALLLAALALLSVAGCSSGKADEAAPTDESGETEIVVSGMLSKQRLHDWVDPQQVETVTFWDSLGDAPMGAVDLSAAGDKSVLGWMDGSVLCLAGEGGVIAPQNSSYLFSIWQAEKGKNAEYRWDKLRTVNGADHFHTEQVVNMCSMFDYCESLTSIDVSAWDVSHVQNMNSLFAFCRCLEALDVSGWNTESAEELNSTFCYCTSLAELDVSGWNTAQVKDVRNLFYNCASLRSLDVSGWKTGKIKQNSYAFTGTAWEDMPPF